MITSIFAVIQDGYAWSDSFGPGVTVLDSVSLSTCLLGASALFDLIYDESLRPLYVCHHLAMLLAIQGTPALIMSLPTSNETQLLATFEAIKVGLTWGMSSKLLDAGVPSPDSHTFCENSSHSSPERSHRRLSPAYSMGTTPNIAGHSRSAIPGFIHDNQMQDSGQALWGV
ncbi:hypothetical protein ASPVEDRAFT_128983 [Aspergillus versicolor CBS 583.65]|uniref:Uncharacterized protein n=1 Tax=Aspergillus versicolor CBS 583.65 TaxID=1036611 RepID=A0A1L9PDR6_ASPVE|nr:uncharacterized protein ASPVEDRAFT_128983 [Aspergillus versicolor CBS 583.65]OJI99632.1 hypothetical protein ASPVEDRAFT_128983 [Aspergillus versicolor CBS 583.65]